MVAIEYLSPRQAIKFARRGSRGSRLYRFASCLQVEFQVSGKPEPNNCGTSRLQVQPMPGGGGVNNGDRDFTFIPSFNGVGTIHLSFSAGNQSTIRSRSCLNQYAIRTVLPLAASISSSSASSLRSWTPPPHHHRRLH